MPSTAFPVVWDHPDDALLAWHLSRPWPMLPLDAWGFALEMHGWNRAAQAYETPLILRRGCLINTFFYGTIIPAGGTSTELAERDQRYEQHMRDQAERLQEQWAGVYLPEIRQRLGVWHAFDVQRAIPSELSAHLDWTATSMTRLWEIHFLVIFPVLYALSEFDDLYRELFRPTDPLEAARLLTGFDNMTLEADRALWSLSRTIAAAPNLRAALGRAAAGALEHTDADQMLRDALRDYLDRYGQRTNEPELSRPRWAEEPRTLIERLVTAVTLPDNAAPAELAQLAADREKAVAAVQHQRVAAKQADRFDKLLMAAQVATVLSEEHAFWIDAAGTYEVRRVLLAAGQHLVSAGQIEHPTDVFYLTFDQLLAAVEALPANVGTYERVVEQQARLARWASVIPPQTLGTPRAFAARNTSFRRFLAKFMGTEGAAPTPDTVQGTPASGGTARGPACVVRSLNEASRVRPGDILITATTSPAWTPLFMTVAAVVTDSGGVLSHCAVVAREYRLPAVVGTGHATTLIRDGQIVEVNGTTGVVRIVATAPAREGSGN